MLHYLVHIACDALPGADEVSLTLVRGERPFTAAHTGPLGLAADELQYERGYGPGIDAGVSGTLLFTPDLREESRWPDYAANVVPLGVLASPSVPLPLQTEVVGALNCYAERRTFWRHSGVAVALASHVAVAVGNAYTHSETARYAEDMEVGMANRSVIEQAKGVIMAQNRCDPGNRLRHPAQGVDGSKHQATGAGRIHRRGPVQDCTGRGTVVNLIHSRSV